MHPYETQRPHHRFVSPQMYEMLELLDQGKSVYIASKRQQMRASRPRDPRAPWWHSFKCDPAPEGWDPFVSPG